MSLEESISVPLDKLDEILKCKLCSDYFQNAHTFLECLHTFCYSCMTSHISSTSHGLFRLQSASSTSFTQKEIQLSESINQGTLGRFSQSSPPLSSGEKSSISCPTCSLQIGYLHNLHSKFMYDRNIQSMVDKIFPLKRKHEEEKRESENTKISQSKTDEESKLEIVEEKETRRQQESSSNRPQLLDQTYYDQKQAEAEVDDSQLNEYEFLIKVVPLNSTSPAYLPELALPPLPRPSFKGNLHLKILKIVNFIFRRLKEESKSTLQLDQIQLLFNDKVLANGQILNSCDSLVEKVRKSYLKNESSGGSDLHIYISYQLVKS